MPIADQQTWKDMGIVDLQKLDDIFKLQEPELFSAAHSSEEAVQILTKALKTFEPQSNRATEQLSKNKEKFGLKPEKVIHLFGYVCSCCNCLISLFLCFSVSLLLCCSVVHELPFFG